MKSMEIIEGALDTVVFFIFLLTVWRIQMFLALNLPYSKGNNPSKFQLAEVRRFGEVREQTNRQTHSSTDRQALPYFLTYKVASYQLTYKEAI